MSDGANPTSPPNGGNVRQAQGEMETTSKTPSLTDPPHGGKVRPWEAVGMTRATWYRKGKPEPARPMSPELAELTAGLKEAFARNPYMVGREENFAVPGQVKRDGQEGVAKEQREDT